VANAVDYVIGESKGSPLANVHHRVFSVTKFGDGDFPLNTYTVLYNPITGYGKCDCPAAAYRNTGSADKHVKMVAAWLNKIEPK
jgi:hypothetical protein